MNSVLEIKNDTSYITFEIRGYENKNADNYHDANWLKATLRCSIPPFAGTLEVSFTTEDMVSFQKDLENIVIYNNVGKEIGFFSLDDDFAIKMKLANTGSVETYGVINSSLNGTSSLNFKFTSNLPYMDNLLNRLKTLVEQYPVNNIDEKN